MSDYPPAPECDRMIAVAPFSHHVGDFLDWLEEQGIWLAKQDADEEQYGGWLQHHERKEVLLARFYKIDLDKVETERRAILAHLQTEPT